METDFSPRYRWAAAALIALAAIVRLIYLGWWCPLDLAPDEALYWNWSRHLDWCYQSKGPLVAWLIRLSCELFGDTVFAVRVPAVLCGTLLLFGLYTLTARVHRSDKLAFGVVALALTLPIVAAGSTLMTIDAPFTCAWMWALVFAHQAAFREARWAWPMAGVFIALGILAKHTMLLWAPSFALFLFLTPAFRVQFFKPGFWLMTGIGALGGVPILVWNALNGWATLQHTQGHAGFEDDAAFHWLGPLHYLGSQFAILLGFWFVVWMCAMWAQQATRAATPEQRFLWWMSAPTFVFFGLFSFANGGGGPNWPLAGYLSGMVLAADWWTRKLGEASKAYRRAATIGTATVAALGLVITVVVHEPIAVQPIFLSLAGPATREHPLPIRRVDPTSRLRGWRFLAAEVDKTRFEQKRRGVELLLATERWTQASELAFYCKQRPAVYCLGAFLGDRVCQYDLWRPNPVADEAVFRGQSFLLVGADVKLLEPVFTSMEPIRTITYRENDQPIAEWTIVVAHGYRGRGELHKIDRDSR